MFPTPLPWLKTHSALQLQVNYMSDTHNNIVWQIFLQVTVHYMIIPPGRATTPVLSHSPPSLLQLSPWDDNCSISLPSSTPQPTRSALSPTFANSTSSLLSPTFANSSASAGNLLLSPNNFTAILPAPANTPTCRETALRSIFSQREKQHVKM